MVFTSDGPFDDSRSGTHDNAHFKVPQLRLLGKDVRRPAHRDHLSDQASAKDSWSKDIDFVLAQEGLRPLIRDFKAFRSRTKKQKHSTRKTIRYRCGCSTSVEDRWRGHARKTRQGRRMRVDLLVTLSLGKVESQGAFDAVCHQIVRAE